MAAQTFKLKLDKTDRIFPPGVAHSTRVRPGETVEVDLEEEDQAAAFDDSLYDVVVETPHKAPFSL